MKHHYTLLETSLYAACLLAGLVARRATPLEHAGIRVLREAVGPQTERPCRCAAVVWAPRAANAETITADVVEEFPKPVRRKSVPGTEQCRGAKNKSNVMQNALCRAVDVLCNAMCPTALKQEALST